MKTAMLLAALAIASIATAARAQSAAPAPAAAAAGNPYLRTIISDPGHPKLSAKFLFTSKFVADGGVTDVALIYHKGEPTDPWPTALTNAGIAPPSYTVLEAGAGGNSTSAFIHAGVSLNVAPTLLGPMTNALKGAGGNAALIGNLLVAPDGSGLNLGVGWKSNVIDNRALVRFDDLRFPPRYSIGYTYQF